ncbi:MAG: hypothetical protein ABSE77_17365 [Acidimicrobiales bacterium]|jgi:hypothetical protein
MSTGAAIDLPRAAFAVPVATDWGPGVPYGGVGGGRNGRQL